MHPLTWQHLKQCLGYFFLNLATPAAFYWAFYQWGAKAAIGLAVAVSLLQTLTHLIFRVRPSPIFICATLFTVAFGGLDLLLRNPQFYRFEPFAHNLAVALFFLATLLLRLPLAYELIQDLPRWLRPKITTPGDPRLKTISWIWIFYLVFKAAVYLYLALTVDLGNLILLRTAVGGGSMAVLFLITYFLLGRHP